MKKVLEENTVHMLTAEGSGAQPSTCTHSQAHLTLEHGFKVCSCIKKQPHISGPEQVKPVSFQGI